MKESAPSDFEGNCRKPEIETYTCLLPWRLGLGALPVDGRPSRESNTSSKVVELGDGFIAVPVVVRSVTSVWNKNHLMFQTDGDNRIV